MRFAPLFLLLASILSLTSPVLAQTKDKVETPVASAKPASSAKAAASAKPGSPAQQRGADEGVPLDELNLDPRQKKILETLTRLNWTEGPTKVPLAFDCTVELPAAYRYLDAPQSKKLLEAYGHTHNDNVLGIIGPKADEPWQVYLDYDDPGYVKDDEKLDADEIMKAMQEGQAEVNKERVNLGHQALSLIGWSESPRYDKALHHVIWGMKVRSDGDAEDSINYNTRILGRKGFVALNLVTDASKLEQYKPRATELLKATTFNSGSRYEDHTSSDKVAEYGLAGLILGGAGLGIAKVAGKVGILALLAKGGKGIFVLLAAPFLLVKKFFSRKNAGEVPPGGPS